MILIDMPTGCEAEKSYIVRVLFDEFLGIKVRTRFLSSIDKYRISSADGKAIDLPDVFFRRAASDWLGKTSLPEHAVWLAKTNDVIPFVTQHADIPVIFGVFSRSDDSVVAISDGQVNCKLDILGSCFFLLTRYEEAVVRTRNKYGNFPHSASVLSPNLLVLRPIVNEYLEVLWACLKHVWPELKRPKRSFRLMLTHDVDRPLSMQRMSGFDFMKKVAAGLLYYRDLDLTRRRIKAYMYSKKGNSDVDTFNTFDFIMETAERHGLRSAFYFIVDHTAGRIDGDYRIQDPWIRALLRNISNRGHEIGLHGSYNSFQDEQQTIREANILRSICEEEGIALGEFGGRQHYLRWDPLVTWNNADSAGLVYDSSLEFAEHVGFRTGTCYEYPAYSLLKRRPLNIRERPLIAMDGSLFAKEFMGLTISAAKETMHKLSETCKFYEGDFVCLFHNSSLETKSQKKFFEDFIKDAV